MGKKKDRVLPSQVVAQDRVLRKAEQTAGEQLCQLRWHWTLNQENPGRVSFSGYGRQTKVSRNTIWRDAQAWRIVAESGLSITEARTLATMSADRRAAFRALSKVESKSAGVLYSDRFLRAEADSLRNQIVSERETHLLSGGRVDDFDLSAVALRLAQERVYAVRRQRAPAGLGAERTAGEGGIRRGGKMWGLYLVCLLRRPDLKLLGWYIGYSKNLNRRLRDHLSESSNREVRRLIRQGALMSFTPLEDGFGSKKEVRGAERLAVRSGQYGPPDLCLNDQLNAEPRREGGK